MWHTGLGDRLLVGYEAEVFRRGLARLVDRIENEPEHQAGVPVFDRLGAPEKMAVLELVGRFLLVERDSCPELTAVNEGTIAAVYEQFLDDLEVEIDLRRTDLRRLVQYACRECQLIDGLPSLRCQKADDWADAVEGLMSLILWDRDWEAEYVKPDDLPDWAGTVRDLMGVDADYYTAVAPDPNPQQLEKIRLSLRQLCTGGNHGLP
jgi:hypothetical protein